MFKKYKIKAVIALLMLAVAAGVVKYILSERQLEFSSSGIGQKEASTEKNTPNAPVAYDPSKCKRDAQGMVYFAAGRRVFRIPYEEPLSIRGMSKEERATLPKRPDPSELEGCPDNPIWGSAFSLPFKYKPLVNSDGDIAFSMRTEKLSIVASESPNSGMQRSYESDFVGLKNTYNACDESIRGFFTCRMPSAKKEFMGDMELTAYQTKPEIYGLPFGGKLTVSCVEPYAPIARGRKCSANYKLYKDINLFYHFYRKNLPASELINYDSALRAYIDSILVKDYSWSM